MKVGIEVPSFRVIDAFESIRFQLLVKRSQLAVGKVAVRKSRPHNLVNECLKVNEQRGVLQANHGLPGHDFLYEPLGIPHHEGTPIGLPRDDAFISLLKGFVQRQGKLF